MLALLVLFGVIEKYLIVFIAGQSRTIAKKNEQDGSDSGPHDPQYWHGAHKAPQGSVFEPAPDTEQVR